jgi:hypothetical protein
MSDCAQEAGLSEGAFAALMGEVARDPERAFEDMRALLLDASNALFVCAGAIEAQAALEALADHRFAPLLHHFQLSNWILYARAYAAPASGGVERSRRVLATGAGLARLAGRALDRRRCPIAHLFPCAPP